MQLTSFGWLPLSIFGGAMDGLSYPLVKYKGMPYVIMLFIGIGWFVLPIGLAPFAGLLQGGGFGLLLVSMTVLVGIIFWVENIARFDAINKAPFVGYVLMVLGTSEDVLVFAVEPLIKRWKGEAVNVHWFEVVGVLFALSSALLHYYADRKRKKPEKTAIHFTTFGWVPLSVFAGVIAGFGQLVAKSSGQAGMSPVVFVGIVGLVWICCSLAFIVMGPLWQRAGLPPTTTIRQVMKVGPLVIVLMLMVGFMTAAGNIAKFDAIMNKAPLIGFVLVVAPVSVFVTSFALELLIKAYRRARYNEGSVTVDRYDLIGVTSAFFALCFFQFTSVRAFLGF